MSKEHEQATAESRRGASDGSASVASNCCGEPPRYVRSFGRWKLMCGRCGRNSSLGIYLPTIARAITVWNTLEEPWDEKPNNQGQPQPPKAGLADRKDK